MIAYPIKITGGKVDLTASYEEEIAQSLRARLLAAQGTIFGYRSFGSLVTACLFEPITAVAKARVLVHTRNALRAETRIDILGITAAAPLPNTMSVDISYRIIANNKVQNLNFSF